MPIIHSARTVVIVWNEFHNPQRIMNRTYSGPTWHGVQRKCSGRGPGCPRPPRQCPHSWCRSAAGWTGSGSSIGHLPTPWKWYHTYHVFESWLESLHSYLYWACIDLKFDIRKRNKSFTHPRFPNFEFKDSSFVFIKIYCGSFLPHGKNGKIHFFYHICTYL